MVVLEAVPCGSPGINLSTDMRGWALGKEGQPNAHDHSVIR